jgi:plasmid stabilization system protein ParE
MKLRYTERAIADLEDIQTYIAQDDPTAAVRVGGRIRAAIELLEDFPNLGRASRISRTRVLLVARTPYAVYYSVKRSLREVAILHIRHGRRRPVRSGEL